MISIIIPTRNETKTIHNTLSQFEREGSSRAGHSRTPPARSAGSSGNLSRFEIIVSDASSDQTAEIARNYARTAPFPIRVVSSLPGRARQMNEGACLAQGDILLFLHADTFLPAGGLMLIKEACHIPRHPDSPCDEGSRPRWGGFCLQFEDSGSGIIASWFLKFIAWRSNFRLKIFKIVYGDQALWVERKLFNEIGGFREMPILEDLEISKRLRSKGKMAYIQKAVTTSPRRFLENRILRVYIKMFCVLLMYKLGIKPEKIKIFYEKQ